MYKRQTYVSPTEELGTALNSKHVVARAQALDYMFALLSQGGGKSGASSLIQPHADRVGELLRDRDATVSTAAARVARLCIRMFADADDTETRLVAATMTARLPLAASA